MSIVDKLLANAGLKPQLAKTGLTTRVLCIGPAEARALLAANKDNRPLRPKRVRFYAQTMLQKGWHLTHQGLGFSASGIGLDLQHRLNAVIESGMTIEIMVTEGLSDAAFEAIDQHERRSISDALRVDRTVTECARLMLACGSGHAIPTVLDVGEACATIQAMHDQIMAACGTKRAIFGSAPARCAAILLMDMRPTKSAQVVENYRNLVLGHSELWTPVMHTFNRQCANGNVRTNCYAERMDLMARAFIVLDPARANQTRIQVNEESIIAIKQRALRLIQQEGATDAAETQPPKRPARRGAAYA